jgi:hypothetical protein
MENTSTISTRQQSSSKLRQKWWTSLTSWAFVLFGIDWILEIALASVTGIDTTTFLPAVYDTKHLLPLLHS